ncbi:MAG: hypothetical protein HW395_50 [candidate division NC10 bacterium]|nr:hypothetical protein [candidate division NC10 bacterium]
MQKPVGSIPTAEIFWDATVTDARRLSLGVCLAALACLGALASWPEPGWVSGAETVRERRR